MAGPPGGPGRPDRRRLRGRDTRAPPHRGHPGQGHLPEPRQPQRPPARRHRRPDAGHLEEPASGARRRRPAADPPRPQAQPAALQRGHRARLDPQHHRRPHRQPAGLDGTQLHPGRRLRLVARGARGRGGGPPPPGVRHGAGGRGARGHAGPRPHAVLPAGRPFASGADPALRQVRRRNAPGRRPGNGGSQAARGCGAGRAADLRPHQGRGRGQRRAGPERHGAARGRRSPRPREGL